MRCHVAVPALLVTLTLGACGTSTEPPEGMPCRGLVDASDSAAFVQYSVERAAYWDVTLAVLQNTCAHSVDVVGLEVGAAMGLVTQGGSVAGRPDQVFAAAPVDPVPLPPLRPFRVQANGKVQVVGRFAVIGASLSRVPNATLTFRDGGQHSSLTLTPKVSLCACGPPP